MTSRVGNGREYAVKWTDGSQTTVSSRVMFGAFTPDHLLEPGDHVIGTSDDVHFLAGTVVNKDDKNGKLTVKFCDGSTRYVTLYMHLYFARSRQSKKQANKT